MSPPFKALVVRQTADGFSRAIEEKAVDELPEGELLVEVAYSSLNYKDALSAVGNRGVTRSYPHTPGIDAVGTVAHSGDGRWAVGDEVLLTGFDLGMNTAGGFGGYVRVPTAWALRRPLGLDPCLCMLYGTAGLTAALCVDRLQQAGVKPDSGPVAVSGASGGVGSIAVGILARLGYDVHAVSGKEAAADTLKRLGAAEVLPRAALADDSGKPLLKAQWAGAVDTVGGQTLANLLKGMQWGGAVSCCGLVGGADLPLTVFPFILRGVALLGVDSVECPLEARQRLWQKLATEWRPKGLEDLGQTCSLAELSGHIDTILQGGIAGRVVVDLGR